MQKCIIKKREMISMKKFYEYLKNISDKEVLTYIKQNYSQKHIEKKYESIKNILSDLRKETPVDSTYILYSLYNQFAQYNFEIDDYDIINDSDIFIINYLKVHNDIDLINESNPINMISRNELLGCPVILDPKDNETEMIINILSELELLADPTIPFSIDDDSDYDVLYDDNTSDDILDINQNLYSHFINKVIKLTDEHFGIFDTGIIN